MILALLPPGFLITVIQLMILLHFFVRIVSTTTMDWRSMVIRINCLDQQMIDSPVCLYLVKRWSFLSIGLTVRSAAKDAITQCTLPKNGCQRIITRFRKRRWHYYRRV